ncbi:MAG TPA: recombinase family protein [Nevskiaceae bacterium]|nr:recombinase family protein [Nevskiaceae bacterium]
MDNQEENRPYRVIAYLRKSSEDTKEGKANRQLNSLSYQRRAIDRIIKREGLKLLKEPFQDDHTGYKAYVRDGFNEMIDYLEANKDKVDGIVCFEISRLARNFGDGGLILWYLQDDVFTRIFTHDKTFTDSKTDQLMVAIEFALAKHSSDATSLRSKMAAKDKILTEKQPSKKPILGYKGAGKKGKRRWILDKRTAPFVRKIFEEFATGQFTLEKIADYAHSIGLRSKSPKNYNGRIHKNTVSNRLRDAQYTGIIIFKGEKYPGAYPPIISTELFYKVQRVFEKKKHPKSTHREYAYTGLILCKNCKEPMSGTHKKGNTYYRCGKKKLPCNRLHKVQYINEKDLEENLAEAFETIEINQKRWQLLREYVFEISQEDKGKYIKQARRLAIQIATEEENLKKYAKSLVEREIDKSTYNTLKKDSEEKIKLLRESQIKCENYVDELKSLMFRFLDNIKHITKRFRVASPANKREMVEIFCENLIWDNKKARWDWRKPYFYLAKPQKNTTWLRG